MHLGNDRGPCGTQSIETKGDLAVSCSKTRAMRKNKQITLEAKGNR